MPGLYRTILRPLSGCAGRAVTVLAVSVLNVSNCSSDTVKG